MKQEEIHDLLNQADKTLDIASEARMKPEEDIIHFSICHNSRTSIRMYLTSFLLKNGVKPDANSSIMELIEQCAKFNDQFKKIDISEIECGGSRADKNDEYCLSVEKVTSCYDAAHSIKKITKELV